MGLSKYRQKRNFKETPEPTGGKSDSEQLRFVVQKHDASHLHYDFRLEMEGVLKSWAVPKGPSLDPSVKRLAMMVEDHPYDYKDFEGIIPSGYGAGTVIVWDEGTYESSLLEGNDKKEQDKNLRQQLHKGNLKVTLHGKKLKGEFALVKTKGMGENSWLLIKHKDKYASSEDVLKKDKSVISNKTLEQIKKTSKNLWISNREAGKANSKKTTVQNKTKAGQRETLNKAAVKKSAAVTKLLTKGKKKAFPPKLAPMLATPADKLIDKPGWVYEVKWEGYRTLAWMNEGKVNLLSEDQESFNEKFYPVYESMKAWGVNAIVDGEIVVLDKKGRSLFNDVQNWRNEDDGKLVYYVFDLLWLDGKDVTMLPLLERRKLLEEIIPDDDHVRISEIFEESGEDFYNAAKQNGLQGIVAKKANSAYFPGSETKDWLEITIREKQEKRRSNKEKKSAGKEKKTLSKVSLKSSKETSAKSNSKGNLFLNSTDETQVLKINGHELTFTNLHKLYWPKEKITKRDLLNYYHEVAPHMLPYLKDRPQSLNRHPEGINRPGFYQKDVTGMAPDWVETFLYHSEDDVRDKHFLVAKDEASLLYMASLGCIEINPWSSRIQKPDYPDWCIIDLDPDKNSFDQVIETALVTREVLNELGAEGYCKTSGSTGLHIYIPLGAKYTYEQSKEFARVVVTLVNKELPKFTTLERSVKARKGKMYLDFLQNKTQATIAAPYSVRPKPMATVSMPLHWEEVKKGLKMQDFTIFNTLDRLRNEGDPFKPVLGKGVDLQKIIKKFHSTNN
jgi:DNA ligase D-like protein (predicted polymerase)/DNA ligase D-like protein (predicted 3'-phosphoesterase)